MAQIKAMTGNRSSQDNQPRCRSSIVNRVFSVTAISSVLSLGIVPFLPLGSTVALAMDSSSDRPSSSLSLNPSSRSGLSTVSSSTSTEDITQPNSLNDPAIEAQTVAQLPDILWDIIPADVLPPGIIPDGEFLEFLQDAGELLQTVSDRRGQYALITASALANDNPRLVSWLSQLQNSPIGTMTFSGVELGDFSEQLITTLNERNQAVDAIALQAQQESTTAPSVNFETLPDLREKGSFKVLTETIVLAGGGETEEATAAGGMVDIYVPIPVDLEPHSSNKLALGEASASPHATPPAPVIVISHGVGGARTHFSELANHLTSYGFVVVVPDHTPIARQDTESRSSQPVTSQLTQLGEQVFGELNPGEFVQRPLTVSALLDELERLNTSDPMWMGRLDMEKVGIIGHSLGGYTGLALVSGNLNQKQVKRTCKDDEVLASNLSLVLQCQAEVLPRRLPSLGDDRIKAVMALNPVASAVLGEKQIEDIEVPVMIVAGSHDAIAPMMSEQIPTFSWLTTPHKYLVTMVPAGHASVNLNNPAQFVGLSQLVSGPQQALGAEVTQALSVAFMETHLSNPLSNTETPNPYLNAAYGDFLSNRGVQLHLIKEYPLIE